MEKNNKINEKELGWKPSFSIIVGVGWLIFLIIWLAFHPENYSGEKIFAIILLGTLVMFVLLGGTWAMYGISKIPAKDKEMFKIAGFKWRVVLSIVLPFISMIFLILWFWFSDETSYDIWQHIAVILVILLINGGILGAVWARWGIKHSDKFDKKYDKED